MGVEYSQITCKTALSKSSLPGLDYSLNPYFGCEHGCRYCYVPSVFRRSVSSTVWGSFVKVKRGINNILRDEVKRKRSGVVGVSTVTDPYQPVERSISLTRSCLEILLNAGFTVSLQTKSCLFLRDLDLMDKRKSDIGITLTTLDEEVARLLEPKASSPKERVQALYEASSQGFTTWIFLGPIIPLINDSEENIDDIVQVANKTKSKVIYDRLNLKPRVFEFLKPVLEKFYSRVELNNEMDKRLNEGWEYWHKKSWVIQRCCQALGVECESAF